MSNENGSFTAWVDGAARGNPGPASYGVHIEDADGSVVAELKECLGETTNNVAEYKALLAVLEWALDNGASELQVYTDSQLLERQIKGAWKVKHPNLKGLYLEARAMAGKLDRFSIAHVRRENNKDADRLANEALDSK